MFQIDGDSPIRPEAIPWKMYFDLRGIPGTLVNRLHFNFRFFPS
jgi:hypothetical protein